jgi:ferredoxin-NADP reductase
MTTSATAIDRPQPKLSAFKAVVRDAIVETHDTTTFLLDAGQVHYRAGQYVTIDPHQFEELHAFIEHLEHDKRRREAPRAYSLSSAPGEPLLGLTVKQEAFWPGETPYPPLLSGYLVRQLRVGDSLTLRGFLGSYTLPDEAALATTHVLHLCAGSGSVANLSILKDSLGRHPHLQHTFVYSNRTWNDVIFRDQLGQLQQAHGARLRVIHRLTRDPAPLPPHEPVAAGRIDLDLLRPILAVHPGSRVFVCGPGVSVRERRASASTGTAPPPRFIETMLSYLEVLDVPRAQIKVECYG